jgi:hypothetical protein
VKRLAVSALLLLVLTGNSGCCLLRELWYALPLGGCRLYGLGCCLDHCGCHDGCGEKYWGEISDPPACIGCGPCNHYGHWCGHCAYPGYTPHGHGMPMDGYHEMHHMPYNGQVMPETIGVPTPAPPQVRTSGSTRTVSSRSSAGQMARTSNPSREPVQVIGRAPSDAEMGLPPGAKIIDRTDRVVGESDMAPAHTRSINSRQPQVRPVATSPRTNRAVSHQAKPTSRSR